MKISRLRAQNFKSFDTVDVELGDLNVFIGANASGKSNFLSILTFLRDIARDGLKDAVSMQSGEIELLRNVQLGAKEPTEICLDWGYGLKKPDERPGYRWGAGLQSERVELTGSRYELGLEYDENNFRIFREKTAWAGYFTDLESESESFGTRSSDRESPYPTRELAAGDGPLFDPAEHPGMSLLRAEPSGFWFSFARNALLRDLQVYDFHKIDALAGASSQKGRTRLEGDGRNVALVLRRLLKDEEKRRKFLNLATTLLPFVEDLDVEQIGGQSLLVTLQESHSGGVYLPSSLLSDGTVRIIALLIALYFSDNRIVAVEEPTTSLHPKLISQLMQMMKEVSEEKQVFITTHNPEVIRHVDLDDVYLVSRDANGFSQITKPGDSEVVRSFLENELGIDDLFVDDLLSL